VKPYLIISDTHVHSWHAFSTVLPNGVNSRLQIILDAHREAVARLKAAGGDQIFHGGDLTHVRGNIAPSVLNPTLDLYKEIVDAGNSVYITVGNHDAEARDSHRVSNAVTAMESIGAHVAHTPMTAQVGPDHSVTLFPWYASVTDLCTAMRDWRKTMLKGFKRNEVVIHAPIDRVLPTIPDHGLRAEDLATIGFDRVFAGHFHNFKSMGDGVYSIGALTHQTFGDIGSKAGYLLVYPDRVEHFETSAPKFIDITGDEDPDELDQLVAGNYVRVRVEITGDDEREEIKAEFTKRGAKAVLVDAVRIAAAVTRGTSAAGKTITIEESIGDYVTRKALPHEVNLLCADILSQARAAA
jgi:DNA repair exonuclease SbcCD nuclease subunit